MSPPRPHPFVNTQRLIGIVVENFLLDYLTYILVKLYTTICGIGPIGEPNACH